MPAPENDSKAGRLSKRINFLKKITKGSKGNILHAMDMVIAEFPSAEENPSLVNTLDAIRLRVLNKLIMIEEYSKDIEDFYEKLKVHNPEYKLKHKPRKRKAKGA